MPQDWVNVGGKNRVTLGEEVGGDPSQVTMVVSRMQQKEAVEAEEATSEPEVAFE